MKKRVLSWIMPAVAALMFVVFTIFVSLCDVAAIGPEGSEVGLSHVNSWFHELTGVHFFLYELTDFGSIPAVLMGMCFGVVGLVQWIKRRSLWRVDGNILALGLFYIFVFGVYLLFECLSVNYRPVLIEGVLEASYPSSTTVLALTFMISAMAQIHVYIGKEWLCKVLDALGLAYAAFLVVGRVISGVHWFTDIVGAALAAGACLLLYFPTSRAIREAQEKSAK